MSYLEVKVTHVYGGGRVVIPKEVRELLEIMDGDRVLWMIDRENGVACIRKVSERRLGEGSPQGK